MTIIRWVLGIIILSLDFVTRPKPIKRDYNTQKKINRITKNMSLYQYKACPFCVKVRRKLRKYSLNIELKDAKNNKANKNDLKNLGGKLKVPCLKIGNNTGDIQWLYESKDIINFLEKEIVANKY
jgi:glutaredoxin